MSIIYILLAILMLAILIVVHEFGHFTAARIMKIDVNEFAVGFGPKLLRWKSRKHETVFSVRAVPLGGFCAFYGEDDRKGITKDDPRAFANQNVWKRMFVILMGPVMNFVLAFAVATVFYWCAGQTVPTEKEEYDTFISKVTAASPADRAGLKDGDVVLEINGVNMQDGAVDTLPKTIAAWENDAEPLKLTVLREGQTFETDVWPARDENGVRRIGVEILGYRRTVTQSVGFFEGFECAWDLCVDAGGAVLEALKNLVTKGEGLDEVGGPVGIVAQVSELTQQGGIKTYIWLMILISVNLGLMNLLPIPGLDGSRLIFGIIEVIRKKPVPPEKEAIVHLVGMALLFTLMIFFTFRDVFKLFKR